MGHVEGLEDWGLEAFNFTKKGFFWWFLSLLGFGFVFGGFWVFSYSENFTEKWASYACARVFLA